MDGHKGHRSGKGKAKRRSYLRSTLLAGICTAAGFVQGTLYGQEFSIRKSATLPANHHYAEPVSEALVRLDSSEMESRRLGDIESASSDSTTSATIEFATAPIPQVAQSRTGSSSRRGFEQIEHRLPSPSDYSHFVHLHTIQPPPPPMPSTLSISSAAWLNQEEDARGSLAPDQTLGEEPPESPNTLQFLRQQTPLNAAGQWQFDIGFSYALFDFNSPIAIQDNNGDIIGVAQARSRQRLLTMPMELRYGLTDNLQMFIGMPVGYSDSELTILGNETHLERAGVGDIFAGFNALLYQGGHGRPDIIGTVGFSAPTGYAGQPLQQGLNPAARLGEGFWTISTNFLVVHQYDPVVVFWGAGYRHRFENDIAGIHYRPGEEFNYQLGVGFAVNPEITLSGSFLGAYMSHWELNGQELPGSVMEPQRMRFAVTVLRHRRIIEPFAEIGMTPAAPSGRFGVTWTY